MDQRLNRNEAITPNPLGQGEPRIETRFSLPKGVLLLPGIGLAMCALAIVYQEPNWAIGSVFFLLLGAGAFLVRPRRMALRLGTEGVEIETKHGKQTLIRYEEIESIKAPERPANWRLAGPPHYAIQVIYRTGVLNISARLTVPSDQVFESLHKRLSRSGSRAINPLLNDYLARQQARYGPEKVLTYRARTYIAQDTANKRKCIRGLCWALTGIVWIVLKIALSAANAWAAFGFLLLIAGLAMAGFYALSLRPFRTPGHFQSASLVIAPAGLALVQGGVQGEMRWNELQKMESWANHRFSRNIHGGIILQFAGTSVTIGDLYDRPLRFIFQAMDAYWREEKKLDAPVRDKLDI
jgi:hypothetical protein